ncbi:LacI family DNA-binding transcriptional regulator [Pseudokineococcus sp. 5B2Z-1]|uniref:LacI family DNA-binding transcriptional regulator n=1 Tax=Pseudokineococcus sp. 5B2Z-1 TaxID=3132744 RepID=UPI00309A8BD2
MARLAGVSVGTVSHALNKPAVVAPPTLARIEAAVEELGYVRNRAARDLVAGDSRTVGMVLVALDNSFIVDIARGAEEAVRAQGRSLLLANADVDLPTQDHYLSLFDESRVAGVLLAPLDSPLEGALRVQRHGRPVVLVNYAADGFCGVVVDEEHGGHLAARHLLDRGRRRLAFVGGPLSLRAVAGRLRGARRAAGEEGLEVEHLPTRSLQPAEGRRVAAELAARPPRERPDGLVIAADSLAVACVQALTTVHGLAVPDDVAVTGYDDNHFVSDAPVPLTTVRQPGLEMGRGAAELLAEEVGGGEEHEHRTVVAVPELLVRASTGG